MNQYTTNRRPKGLLIFFSVLLSVIIVDACRKVDYDRDKSENPNKPTTTEGIIKKFFTLPASADVKVKAIANSIKHQNEKRNFIEGLVKRVGYPL